MQFTVDDYLLPENVLLSITDLADPADCLMVGEIHGTQEIPRIVVSLLPMLWEKGYRGLGVEVPHAEQDSLRRWLSDPSTPLPMFFARPWQDGRGSREMLAMLRRAFGIGFKVFCFDAVLMRSNRPWSARDARMAHHTHQTWLNEFPNNKVVVLCGNNHAFLSQPPHLPADYWPTFAVQLQRSMPGKVIRSLDLHPAGGEFYNMGLRRIDRWFGKREKLQEAHIVDSEFVSLAVEFPLSSAATFVTSPKAPGQLDMMRLLTKQVTLSLRHWILRDKK